jgi:hypothetical protein
VTGCACAWTNRLPLRQTEGVAAIAAAVLLMAPTVYGGQRQWFLPGALRTGATVLCVSHGQRMVLNVPAASPAPSAVATGTDTWGNGVRASIAARPNGAVEVDCDTSAAAPRRATPPYVVGPSGLGLLRGTNTVARLRTLYGAGDAIATATGCRMTWPAAGLTAQFASCAGGSALVRADVVGARWSSLAGVRVGDPLARLVWQDQRAARFAAAAWILGGVGRAHPPRLLALVGPAGTVTGFRVVER